MPGRPHTIGWMSEAARCKVQTIRYYEHIGLLPEPARTPGNQRIYSDRHLQRLTFIRHSRELGFSLDQVREILALSDDPSKSCGDIDRVARIHLQDVESKIERLQGMRTELQRMIGQCAGGRVADCRIVEVLSDHSQCMSDDHSVT